MQMTSSLRSLILQSRVSIARNGKKGWPHRCVQASTHCAMPRRVLLLLCDQPGLAESHLLALRTAWLSSPTSACASAYGDTVGVPTLLPRAWLPDVQALHGDCGARDLWRGRIDEVIAIDAPLLAHDLDTPADLV
jgi:CTP:molybdopterin cytidylyltransferase MocA